MVENETALFNNHFGSITDKRVTLNYKSGKEDIPLGHITSVGLKRDRSYAGAIICFIFAGFALFYSLANHRGLGSIEMLIVMLVVLFMIIGGLAYWFGHHNIVISTSGQDRKPLKVEMAKTREGREFVDAIRKVVFK